MTLTLSPEMEALVKERITRGQFGTPEEVVGAALRLLRDADTQKETELRALLDEAEEDGRVAPFDPLATAARVKAGMVTGRCPHSRDTLSGQN